MSIFQLLFATSSADNTVFEGLNFSAVGDSFTLADGGSNFRNAFCLGRETDYSYTSPNVIWAQVENTSFAKFELQSGTFTKVGSNINTGFGTNLLDIADTGTHIIVISTSGEVNRYNKSTGSLETEVDTGTENRRGVAWKSPFFYTGFQTPTASRDAIQVWSDQSNSTTYQNIVSSTNNPRKGLAYDPEDDLFYQCHDNGGGAIFSTTNSSSNTNSVSFTNEGTLPSWTDRGTLYSFDILKNSNGKFIIGKNYTSGQIWCLHALPNPGNADNSYTAAGSYTWTCPANVTSVSVVCVGAGADSGGGGGLGYKNNISVTPGNSYTVVVGDHGSSGGDSYFISTSTVRGLGANGKIGGSYVGDGGGNGGSGGNGNWPGGGGAGGYSGSGGNGANGNSSSQHQGGNGSGGAGGGGSGWYRGGGGGVGLLGQGASGSGGIGSNNSNTSARAGGGGSGGSSGVSLDGGNYGGGGASGGSGAQGAVRIIWNTANHARLFPSTNVA